MKKQTTEWEKYLQIVCLKLDIGMYTRFNSKLIKDLNVRYEAIKLLEKHRETKLLAIGLCMIFWICHQKQQQQKQK